MSSKFEFQEGSDLDKFYQKSYIAILSDGMRYGIHTFGLVEKIMVVAQNEGVVFQCKNLQVVKHEEHLNAYQVCLSEEVKYIKHESLVDFHPLGLHKGFGFVILRYRVDYIYS